jgi:dipeptide/tripeptide permease
MLIFYALINAGAFFAVGTDYAEKYVGYWLAFLLPGIMYFLLPILLLVFYKRTVKVEPNNEAYNDLFSIIWIALKRNIWGISRKGLKKNAWKTGGLTFWDAAHPSVLRENGITAYRGKAINWTDTDVTDIQRTFAACQIFLYFIIYNLNDGGIGSLLSSQGSTLTTAGAPNDLLGNFNPLVIIIAVPLLSHVIYPFLNKRNIKFGRISRIAFGFTLAWISGLIGALVQWRIYQSSPCGYFATGCTKGTGVSPLSIWIQIPTVTLGAISECFCNVTAYELAYARSPKNMRGLVMSLFLLTNAVSSMVGIVITPAINDPYLVWVWAVPAVVMAFLTAQFWWAYRGLNDDEYDGEECSFDCGF